jgi:replicative DNA helicase
VLICGDNDDAGRKHVAKVQKAMEGLAKCVRVVEVPPEFKDVTEYAESFANRDEFGLALFALAESAEMLTGGVRVPIRSLAEMERDYEEHAKRIELVSLSLARWLPKLGSSIRPLVPGELVTIIADTGVGKTMLLQNLARNTRLTTLLFEMELPETLTFERFVGMETEMTGAEVASRYRTGDKPQWKGGSIDNIHVCSESRLTIQRIEEIIQKAGLKIGGNPQLVLLDYVQLVQGTGGSRYERMSGIAEELKVLAKSTNTIVVIASQVARNAGEEEIGLHSAKDSGSIENSSGLVLGAWRDANERGMMWLKVCKNTKGISGAKTALRIGSNLSLYEEQQEFSDPNAEQKA